MNDVTWNLLTARPQTGRGPAVGVLDHSVDAAAPGVGGPSTGGCDGAPSADSATEDAADADDDAAGDWRAGGEPPNGPPPTSAAERRPARPWQPRRWWLVGCAVAGVAGDVALRAGDLGLMAAVSLVSAALVARFAWPSAEKAEPGKARARDAAMVAGIVLGASVAWRTAAWVVALDLLGAIVAIALAGDAALRARWLLSSGVVQALLRPVVGLGRTLERGATASARWSGRLRRRAGGHGGAIGVRAAGTVRGIVLAVPLLAVLTALLLSADAVFSNLFSSVVRVPTFPDFGPALSHVVLVGTLGLGLASLCAAGGLRVAGEPGIGRGVIGRVESLVVLGAVNVLFATFALVQIVAVIGGARYVRDTVGLTYAEYARRGFFQLLAVACLTLLAIGVVRRFAGPAAFDRSVIVCALCTCALTIAITAVAFRRLWLYESAYGITVARVVAHAGTITVGLVLAVVAWGILRSRPHRDLRGTVTSASLIIGALTIVALDVVNPGAWAARSAVDRALDGRGDVASVLRIGDDGLPELAARLDEQALTRLGGADVLRAAWCDEDAPQASARTWRDANLGAASAERARLALCRRLGGSARR